MQVLLLEDDPIDAEAVRRRLLKRHPEWSLEIAPEPVAALERLRDQVFDAIIVDINLPGMSGFEFLELLPEVTAAKPRVVVFSSSEHRRDLEAATERGVIDYVIKSTDLTCLDRLIERIAAV